MFLGINLIFIPGYIFLNLEVDLIYALINLTLSEVGFGLFGFFS
jgi:hypothetical protein